MAKIVDRIFNTVLTANDSSAQEELGSFRFEDGKIYKYVYFADAVTAAEGAPVLMDGTYNYKVTVDYSEAAGSADPALVVGVALTTNTPEYYGWIQIYGVATVKVTDKVTAGDMLIHSGTDLFWGLGSAASDAAVTEHMFGAIALANSGTDADSTISAFIKCM